MLGPHVVGQRVVVRRLLPDEVGPTGGPAMTDLLGTCEAFGDGVLVVRPEDGAPVTIPLDLVVSGKPVPPRAVVRERADERALQVHGFALFPDLRTKPLGTWVLRDSPTATARRAHSVLAFGPSGVEDDVARVVAHYERPIAAVLSGSAEDARLTGLGWVPESHESDTLFQVAGVARVARALRGSFSPDVAVAEEDHWTRATISGRATGYAGLDGDWVGVGGLHVEEAFRRQGLALSIMEGLVGWGAERGATNVFLQVLADNAPALELYARLGFRTHHAYRYLVPGP